jgi:hypothetical protein
VSTVSADSQIRPDKRGTDDLYIDCVDVIYILLAHLRFISPFCNHLQVS